jgi:hypothetical protein
MPRFSNRPFLAATLSFLSSRAKPRDLRCAIRVPRSYRPTTATHHHRILMETPTSLCHPGFQEWSRNRRSLGFARAERLTDLSRDKALVARSRRACPERSRGNPGGAYLTYAARAFPATEAREQDLPTHSAKQAAEKLNSLKGTAFRPSISDCNCVRL